MTVLLLYRNMITVLLSLGACPEMAEGRSGRTALHMAGKSWDNVARFYDLNLYKAALLKWILITDN